MDSIESEFGKLNKFPYVTIYEWMYDDLGLSANPLVIFAYIYREFVNYNKTKFNKTEIAKKLRITTPTVISAFKLFKNAEIIKSSDERDNNIEVCTINVAKIIALIHNNILKRLTAMIKKYSSNKNYKYQKQLNFLFPNKEDGLLFKLLDNLKEPCNLKIFKNNLVNIIQFENKILNDGEYKRPVINKSNFWSQVMKKIRK